jgi:hypothetical protein
METNVQKDIKKVARGSALSFVGAASGRGLWFLYQAVLARFFGAETFGLYMLAITALKITELLSRFGLHTGAMRFVALYRKDDQSRLKGTLISSFCISFGTGLFLGMVLYFSAGLLAQFVFHKPEITDIIKKMSLAVPFMAGMMVVAMASQGFHTTKICCTEERYHSALIEPLVHFRVALFRFWYRRHPLRLYGILWNSIVDRTVVHYQALPSNKRKKYQTRLSGQVIDSLFHPFAFHQFPAFSHCMDGYHHAWNNENF